MTPLANTFAETWQRLLQNESGITTTLEEALHWQGLEDAVLQRELALARNLPCQVAACVKNKLLLKEDYSRTTNRFVQFALIAGAEAIQQAELSEWWLGDDPTNSDDTDQRYQQRRWRTGVSMGSGMSALREIVNAMHTVEEAGLRKLSPHFVPKVLCNSAAGRLSIAYHLQGPNLAASTACAAGSHAIGDAMRCIQYNNADIMLAGGTEASIDPLSINGFCRLRALSTGFPPNQSSRPFDKRRDGFVMGEGAAVLVLEELQHALARNAPILAELAGYGLTGDAFHSTAPDPEGNGAARAMQMALGSSENAASVDYVNAHATSTPKGDEIEAKVVDRVLMTSDRSQDLYVSGTKGATGHLLGAAGALEAAFTVQALMEGVLPPTLNLEHPDRVGRFQHIYKAIEVPNLKVAMTNSFGFGGTNASLLFRKAVL